MQILNRFKHLLDGYPKNTIEAKKMIAELYGFHPRKIQRWYTNPQAKISLEDSLKLKEFFGLKTTEELYEVKHNRKPIKGLTK